ncbi:MAG TPA: response regulator [Candidatus Binataceae bacterium]|nr:response regulator [Candidatus Binataceae bacterium]
MGAATKIIDLEIPSPPTLQDTRLALRLIPEANRQSMTRFVRNGLVAIAMYEAGYIAYDIAVFHHSLPQTMMFRGSVALLCIAGFLVSVVPAKLHYWRAWAFSVCAVAIALLARVAAIDGTNEPVCLTTVLFILGTGALAPWRLAWELGLIAVALVAMALSSLGSGEPASRLAFEWIVILTAAILAYLSAVHGARLREEVRRQTELIRDNYRQILRLTVSREREAAARENEHRRMVESEDTLAKIIQACPDRLVINRITDGRFLLANNPTWPGGFTIEDLLGTRARDLGVWADPDQFKTFAEQLRDRGRVDSMEVSIRRKDKSVAPYLVSASLVEIGGASCVITTLRDISDLKRTESELRVARVELAARLKALQLSELTFRKVFTANIDCMTIVSLPEGIYLEVNDEFSRTTGYTREEAVGRHFTDFNFFAEPVQMAAYAEAIVQNKEVRNMEITYRRKDGSEYPCLVSAVLMNLHGKSACLTVSRDISALKRAEHELIAAREAAVAAAESKSNFLSSMSHEIRTPLNAIIGMTDLLAETSLTDEQRRYANTIIGNGNALLELINGILDLAKVEGGRMCLEAIEFDLRETVEKTLDALALRAHEKNLELMVRIAPAVPRMVVGDPYRLRQILINLVGNAIKFTDRGQVLVSIESAGSDSVRFSVTDTGIGIPSDKLPTLFDAFTQADSSTTRKYGGSGLGLAIVARLVALMGGEVTVESEMGRGSIFRFTAHLTAPAPDTARTALDPQPPLDGLRVLLVDGNATNRSILTEMLSERGVAVTQAASGAEVFSALESARTSGAPFHAALLDARISGISGYEIARQLAGSPHCGVVLVMMLTTDNLVKETARLQEIGVDNYLVKPVKQAELVAVLARILQSATAKSAQDIPAAATQQSPGSSIQPAGKVQSGVPALRILLADDSPDNRALIHAYLRWMPYTIEDAGNGLQAVDKFIAGNFDLVLMDIRMPVMDGYEAARQIRDWERENHRESTPIIALTASVLDDSVHRTFEAGCDMHVAKPVRKSTLLEAIQVATQKGNKTIRSQAALATQEEPCQPN